MGVRGIVAIVLVAGCADLQGRASASLLYGRIDGIVQVPRGGRPGSSSPQRPTFEELGHDRVAMFDAAVSGLWRRNRIEVGGRLVGLSGSATLRDDLVTGGTAFPAGTTVHSDIRLDWYRLEYARLLPVGEERVTLAPVFGVVLFDFDFELTNGSGLSSRRSYAKWGLRLGGEADWRIHESWSLVGRAYWGLPIEDQPRISSVALLGRYRFWSGRAAVFAGLEYDDLEYKDLQQVPNHIHARLGPLLLLGVEVRF